MLAEATGTYEALLADVALVIALVPVASMVLLAGTGIREPEWTVAAGVGPFASVCSRVAGQFLAGNKALSTSAK